MFGNFLIHCPFIKFSLISFLFFSLLILPLISWGQTNDTPSLNCFVYFTGVGCPHCAKTDPVVLQKNLSAHSNLIIIEYEIYQEQSNAPLLLQYNEKYKSGLGVPLLILSPHKYIIGDTPILQQIEKVSQENHNNACLLLSGGATFPKVDIDNLPGKPKIWYQDRILIATTENKSQGEEAKELLLTPDLSSAISEKKYPLLSNISVALSGKSIVFPQGVQIGSWIVAWHQTISTTANNSTPTSSPPIPLSSQKNPSLTQATSSSGLSWAKTISLASVDAINPCALAVLALMLSSVILYNPRGKRTIILSGLSFIAAVFILYFFYGILIIRLFQFVQSIAYLKYWLYKILGAAALLLGILEIKDFLFYRPGGIATEMPLSLRPKIKKLISKATSPLSAFIIGCFVTVFLLPCTIGPYVIAGGLLSNFTQRWDIFLRLLVYNMVFITPMLAIVGAVYWGTHDIKDIQQWKEKNIRQLHLAAGIILAILGLMMIIGI